MAREHAIPNTLERVMRDDGLIVAMRVQQGLGHEQCVLQLQNLPTYTPGFSGLVGVNRLTKA